jgi:2-keto-4-pentenoate hydratase
MSDRNGDAEARIAAIADKLAAGWEPRAVYEMLTGDLRPASLDEAYEAQAGLQKRLTALRGPIAGRKIALSSKAMQEMVGIDHPIAGAFFARDIRRSGAEVAARDFRHLGIEYELAFELARDVGPDDPAPTPDTVRGLIARVRPAFELIEDRGADYARLDVLTIIADNAWCGAVVLGEEIAGWRELDLANLPAVLHQDGHAPEAANTGAADPLRSLCWVLDHNRARGIAVQKGEVVITGSVLRTRFPAPGDRFRYEVAGRAAVEVSFV